MQGYFFMLDYWTQVALDAIWYDQVKETIENDIETGITFNSDERESHEDTAFTHPFSHIIIDK